MAAWQACAITAPKGHPCLLKHLWTVDTYLHHLKRRCPTDLKRRSPRTKMYWTIGIVGNQRQYFWIWSQWDVFEPTTAPLQSSFSQRENTWCMWNFLPHMWHNIFYPRSSFRTWDREALTDARVSLALHNAHAQVSQHNYRYSASNCWQTLPAWQYLQTKPREGTLLWS